MQFLVHCKVKNVARILGISHGNHARIGSTCKIGQKFVVKRIKVVVKVVRKGGQSGQKGVYG